MGDVLSLNKESKNCRDRFAVAVMVWRCHAFTDFTVAVPALTDLSSYFSEISAVVLGSVDLYANITFVFLCAVVIRITQVVVLTGK